MIQETSPNKQHSVYIYTDEDSYEPLARIDSSTGTEEKVLYYHTDVNGAPEELTNEAGEIVWACSYQLWGKPIQEIEHSQIQQNLRYQGQYLDRETGLHYNTFRYYDPDIGRFTQPDPIGLLGGFNLYQYAPNGLMWIDPWGLDRRNQTEGDVTHKTARAARRAAMRTQNIPTSQTYQIQIIEEPNQSKNSKSRSGILYQEQIIRDNKTVGSVKLHPNGHKFPDGTYEIPHYHGKNGEHHAYNQGKPRSTNKYKVGNC